MNRPASSISPKQALVIAEHVDKVCDQFEAAWPAKGSNGPRPRIEDFLGDVPESGRAMLLRELLRLELAYRRDAGERPGPEEYQGRFPGLDLKDLIPMGSKDKNRPERPRPAENRADKDADSQATGPYVPEPLPMAGTIRAGTMLMNRYCVDRELGRGGMGQVYLARDQVLKRMVAVKLIRPLDPHLRERTLAEQNLREAFFAEAVIGAKLNHPAIATVFDFGFHDQEPLIVFEYVDGETLRETLARRGRLPLDDVRLILAPLAQALQFAHSQSIVHRDLKPANIRSTIHGQYKILDLGLAREFRQGADWGFAGTPRYASPEQAAGLSCDGRTDQYSLALIAFEMLTGRPVVEATSVDEMLRMHREHSPPALRDFLPNVPKSVEKGLERALAKDPNQRFASCEEFAAALGCQFFTNADSPAEVLRLAKIAKMEGFISKISLPSLINLTLAPIHVALGGNSFWLYFRGELRHWPLSKVEIENVAPSSCWLRLDFDGQAQSFRFRNAKECKAWYSHIRQLLDSLPAGAQETGLEAAQPFAGVDPVVVLQHQPSIRYQTLGNVNCTADDRGLAETGMKVRAALMGADAVIDVQEERLVELKRTRWHEAGTAIRAVDSNGRQEMYTRWFGGQCKGMANRLLLCFMFLLISRLLAYALQVPLPVIGYTGRAAMKVDLLMFGGLAAWEVATLVWLRLSLIPQLLRPAALTLLNHRARLCSWHECCVA